MNTTDYDIIEEAPPEPVSAKELRELVLLMAAEGKTTKEIAAATGLDRRRIYEIRGKVAGGANKKTKEREVYQKTLITLLPVKDRAEALASLVRSANPMIRLRALEMADEISQVSAASQQPPALVPLFSLPPGTREPVAALRPEPRKG